MDQGFWDQGFWAPFCASLAAALFTVCGITVIRHFAAWGRQNVLYFIAFAAGVLISVSFLHIVPKSFSMTAQAPAFLLAGYLGMHVLNRFIDAYVCDQPDTKAYAIGLVPMLGIGLHSFLDGVVYSVTFTVSMITGSLAALGMVLHEFPEGIVTYLLLVQGGFSKERSLGLALLAAAATTPLGMLASYPFVSRIGPSLLGSLLALSAGALIYVGATHLLPRAERESRRYSLIALGAGILIAVLIVLTEG